MKEDFDQLELFSFPSLSLQVPASIQYFRAPLPFSQLSLTAELESTYMPDEDVWPSVLGVVTVRSCVT